MPERARANDERKALIRRIHAEAGRLGVDTADRKALQVRTTGKESCADMDAAELRSVLHALGAGRDRLPDHAPARKLRALWISAYHLGVVNDRRDSACCAWLRRQTGVDAAQWVTPGRCAKSVEALQLWLTREAGVDWGPYVVLGRDGVSREVDNPRARALEAQWRRLHELGVVTIPDTAALGAYATAHADLARAGSHTELGWEQAVALMQHLGGRIREAMSADA